MIPAIVRLTEMMPTPWRNGGGFTRELAAEDGATERPGWRISVAEIARSGPFSRFPGYDRTLAVIAGRGILQMGPRRYRLLPGAAVRFTGDADVAATVARTTLHALNVMTNRQRFSHRFQMLAAGEPLPRPRPGEVRLFVAMTPMDDPGYALAAGDLVVPSGITDAMPFPGRVACLDIRRNR